MKIFNRIKFVLSFLLIILMQFVVIPPQQGVYAATAPNLGAADSYAVFGKLGVTNDAGGTTHIWGNVGADSIGDITNLIESQVDGTIIAPAAGVQTAASAAYDTLDLGSQGTPTALDLAGTHTVTPGVYTVGATTLNGTLTLNGAGVYIFRSSSSISTSGAGTMSLINGACASNVFWQIPTSMTIGANANIEGTIIAQTGNITLASGATLKGRALSLVSQVTLLLNQITNPVCAAASSSSSSSSSSTSTPICIDIAPTNNPDLFQIDRAGSTAVLHFTPVSGNVSYYYVAYGLSPGSEEFGVSFPASSSTGAMSFTINDLNPNTTYYFKIRGGYGCAPGGWSNNRESNSRNPLLPNTGMGSREQSVPWSTILIGIFSSSYFVYLAQKKRSFPIKQE